MVVLGVKTQIDNYLSMRGLDPKKVGGYRVTDEDAMLAAMEAAGTARMLVEAQLSKVISSNSCFLSTCLKCIAKQTVRLVKQSKSLQSPTRLQLLLELVNRVYTRRLGLLQFCSALL